MSTRKLVMTALTVTLLGSGAAFAQGKSEGRSHGAHDNGNNGRGAIASELKWRNAAHASAQAFLNANPDSAVGKLATLVNATNAIDDAYAAAGVDPDAELRDPLDIEADIATIDGEILALDPLSPTYDDDLAALEAEIATLEAELALPETLEAAEETKEEAEEVVGVADLSPEAVEALWELLEGK